MGFNVEPYGGKRDPGSVTFSRGSGADDIQSLFEELLGGDFGDALGGEGEDLESFDWEGLWDSFMEGEEGQSQQEEGSYYPTMFGAPIRPSGFRRDTGQTNSPLNMNYY